jgi:hypothetical protein
MITRKKSDAEADHARSTPAAKKNLPPAVSKTPPAPLSASSSPDLRRGDEAAVFPHELALMNPAALGQLMSTLDGDAGEWNSNEMSALLSHQLSAPMNFDLSGNLSDWISPNELAANAKGMPGSFKDLFNHSSPPKRLLLLTKQFAKANWEHPDSPIPPEVAFVLYYTSIAVALFRLGERITRLKSSALKTGFSWVTLQPWVDEGTKQICRQALGCLKPQGS